METEVVPILRVADADAAVRWHERLGFTKQWEHRFDPSCPAFVSIARGGARLFLSEHRGDALPDTLVGLMVSDVDAVVAEFGRSAGDLRTDASSNSATWTVTGCGSASRATSSTSTDPGPASSGCRWRWLWPRARTVDGSSLAGPGRFRLAGALGGRPGSAQ